MEGRKPPLRPSSGAGLARVSMSSDSRICRSGAVASNVFRETRAAGIDLGPVRAKPGPNMASFWAGSRFNGLPDNREHFYFENDVDLVRVGVNYKF